MIQATGTITIGIANYVNPLININWASPQKYSPTYVVAQIGVVVDTIDNKKTFTDVATLEQFFYHITNPSYDTIEPLVLSDLSKIYPSVIFESVA
jgi:hypothetical protein